MSKTLRSIPGSRPAAAALAIAALAAPSADAAQIHTVSKIFDGGPTNFHSYRIPSIVRATNGALIAFAECRRHNNSDWGDINLVFKRSTNNGSTWSALGEVVGTGPGTWGNPTAVTDWETGRIWVFMNWHAGDHDSISDINVWGERKVYTSYSDNHGATWSTPQDRTSSLLPPSYEWDAMGPGVGIQTTQAHAGRLIIPAQGRNIYSDNNGATWQYKTIGGGTESTIVELLNGSLMRNDRPGGSQQERRYVRYGTIENGFYSATPHDTLLDPRNEGSTLRYNTDYPYRILFMNSASTVTRGKMRVRISYDHGVTWPTSRRLYDWLTEAQAQAQGKGGYSSMTKTADFCVGALVEINEDTGDNDNSHRSIDFHKFNLEWIRDGASEPSGPPPAAPPVPPPPSQAVEVIVDNTSSGFSASSNWYTSTATPGYYGSNYHVHPTEAASDTASWTANLPESGNYQVYARWSAGSNRPASAPYIITHSGGSQTVNVNQQANGGQWVSLGTFNFASGSAERVRLSCWTTSGYYAIADAVRFYKP